MYVYVYMSMYMYMYIFVYLYIYIYVYLYLEPSSTSHLGTWALWEKDYARPLASPAPCRPHPLQPYGPYSCTDIVGNLQSLHMVWLLQGMNSCPHYVSIFPIPNMAIEHHIPQIFLKKDIGKYSSKEFVGRQTGGDCL